MKAKPVDASIACKIPGDARSIDVKAREKKSRHFLPLAARQGFLVAIFVFYSCCDQASAQRADTQSSFPNQFVLGFYGAGDYGPPFDHYWLYVVRSMPEGASVEEIALTPPGQRCVQPATIERATKTIKMSVATLLDNRNPCDLTEEELHRKAPPCTAPCRVPLGTASYVMQVKCGSDIRRIPLNGRDEEDIFSPYVSTPKRPLSINQLVLPLVSPTSAMTRVPLTSLQSESADASLQTILDMKAGKYDEPSNEVVHEPSEMVRRIERSMEGAKADVEVESIVPYEPEHFTLPTFPPTAKKDSTDSVSVHLKLDADGKVIEQTFLSGASVFQEAVREAAAGWQFPKGPPGRAATAQIAFGVCPAK